MVSLIDRNKRGQTSTEYIFLAGGVIMAVVIIYALLQGNLVGKQTGVVEAGLADFLKVGEYFLFYDNFDSDSANQWTALQDTWAVENKEYTQKDLADFQKSTYAGSMGWVNFYADAKIRVPVLPAYSDTVIGGISGRANKNTGARYVCELQLASTDPLEGKLILYRFTDWQANAELDRSVAFPLDSSVHLIAIQLNGNSVLCYFDGILQVNYTDLTPFKYGLISLEQRLSEAHFDMVRVKYQNGPTPIGPNPTALPTATPTGSPTPTPSPGGDFVTYNVCSGFSCIPTTGPSGTDECTTDLDCGDIMDLSGCTDGTSFRSCSTTQPYYCNLGDPLVLKCSECGCPADLPYCGIDENCSASFDYVYISDVAASNFTTTSATIDWATNVYSNGSVEYGNTTDYGSEMAHDTGLIAHSLQLADLDPETPYHYRITSCNATLCNSTDDFTFNTTPLLKITNVINNSITETTAWIRWTTNLIANGSVEYGLTTDYGSLRWETANRTSHGVQLLSLTGDTLYHYRITSCNATLCNTTGDYSFRTALPPSCSDTDIAYSGGIAPGTFGTVTTEIRSYPDECNEIDMGGYVELTENYCSGTTRAALTANCDVCANGVCASRFCLDYGGAVYTENGRFQDGCVQEMVPPTKFDYYCSGYAMATNNLGSCEIGDPVS